MPPSTACPGCSPWPTATTSWPRSPPASTSSTPTPPRSRPSSPPPRRASTSTRLEAAERGVDRAARRAVGDPARPAAHRPRGRRPRRAGRRPGRPRRLPRHPAGAVGDRPHGGPRCATPPASTSSCGITTSTPPIRRSPPRSSTRSADPLFANGSARLVGGCLSFVYKAAAEIGELGDNTRALRRAVTADRLLRLALAGSDAQAVGARPHPLGQRRASSPSPTPTR